MSTRIPLSDGRGGRYLESLVVHVRETEGLGNSQEEEDRDDAESAHFDRIEMCRFGSLKTER